MMYTYWRVISSFENIFVAFLSLEHVLFVCKFDVNQLFFNNSNFSMDHSSCDEIKYETPAVKHEPMSVPPPLIYFNQDAHDKICCDNILSVEMHSDSDEDQLNDSKNSTFHSLPRKTKQAYINQFENFMDWCKKHEYNAYTEEVLLQYFTEKSKNCKSSTLCAIYSMLRATIEIKLNTKINDFTKVTAFLKKNSIGYQRTQSKTFTWNEINRFLTDASDETHLFNKVYPCRKGSILSTINII